MNNNNIWGPSAWTFLHTITFNYPENPNNQDKQNYFNFFNSLKHVLPCKKCKKHYSDNSTDHSHLHRLVSILAFYQLFLPYLNCYNILF